MPMILTIIAIVAVILFVRMWVEICCQVINGRPDFRHPLREDVSWNYYANITHRWVLVILFVRMWVEIYLPRPVSRRHPVILFVRMWVEIQQALMVQNLLMSSSSWGCELKWRSGVYRAVGVGHPLCEDVSWNDVGYGRVGASCRHPPREDVSWNLEEYGVNHRCSNMVLLVGRWIEISLIVFLSFARRSHYYTSFNLNIKLNYRNLRGNFYMCF